MMTRKQKLILFRLFISVFCPLLQFCLVQPALAQGRLGSIRKEVRKKEEKKEPKEEKEHRRDDRSRDSHSHHHHRRRRRRNRGSGFALSVFSQPRCEPVFIPAYQPVVYPPPAVVLPAEPVPAPRPRRPLEPTPARPTQEPEFVFAEPNEVELLSEDWFEYSVGKIWATIGSEFDDFTVANFGFQLQAPEGIGLDLSVSNLREDLGSFRDHIWLGDVNVAFEVVSGPDVRGRLGIGVNWMNDGWGSVAGFNLTAGVDVRLSEQWLLIGEGDIGSLGDADFFHSRIGLARRLDRAEWVTGWEHFNIGGVEINSIFTGLQVRF